MISALASSSCFPCATSVITLLWHSDCALPQYLMFFWEAIRTRNEHLWNCPMPWHCCYDDLGWLALSLPVALSPWMVSIPHQLHASPSQRSQWAEGLVQKWPEWGVRGCWTPAVQLLAHAANHASVPKILKASSLGSGLLLYWKHKCLNGFGNSVPAFIILCLDAARVDTFIRFD